MHESSIHPRARFWLTALLLTLAVISALRMLQTPLIWDEGAYLSTAETLGDDDPYFSEIHFRPPLLPVLLNLVDHVVPLPAGGRVIEALIFALGVLLMLQFGRLLWGEEEGFVAAALLVTAPYFFNWSGAILSDVPSAVLSVASLYMAYLGRENRLFISFCGGLFLAAVFLLRWPTLLVGSAALVLLLTGAMRFRSALLYGAGFVAGIAPYLSWAWVRYGNPLEPIMNATSAIEGSEPVSDLLFYVVGIGHIAAPVALAGLVLYLASLGRESLRDWIRRDLPLLVWALVLPIYLTTVVHKEQRYVAAAIPPLFLLASRGWVWAVRGRTAAWRVPVALLAAAALGCTLWNWDLFRVQSSTVDDHRAVSADMSVAAPMILGSLPSGGVVYANHLWPVLSYAVKTKTVRVWPHDERFFRYFPQNMPDDGVFVYSTGIGKEPGEAWLNNQSEFRRLAQFGRVVLYEYHVPGEVLPIDEVRDRVDAARDAYRDGDWAAAAAALEGINDQLPGVGCIHGWSLYKIGEIEQAARAFGELLKVDPEDTCALTGSGYAALRLGDEISAEQSFAAALELDPESVDAMVGAGLAAMRLQKNEEAAGWFRRVLEINPEHGEAIQFLERVEKSLRNE